MKMKRSEKLGMFTGLVVGVLLLLISVFMIFQTTCKVWGAEKPANATQQGIDVPVLAIGVPTVISVPAIIHDVFGEKSLENVSENIDEEFISMHVTPKNIDESMKRISYTISEGINHLLHN